MKQVVRAYLVARSRSRLCLAARAGDAAEQARPASNLPLTARRGRIQGSDP